MEPALEGQTVGHYRILDRLGEGGMGVVYRAEDRRLGRKVAIKFLSESFARDAQSLRRFFQEARTASALNHPNICTIHDIGEHEGHRYLVLELLEGQTLERRLQAGPPAVDSLLDIGIQATDALDAAHAAGIVHRDVKPANLFLTDRGQLKVLDFGIAKPPALSAESITRTLPGSVDGLTEGTADTVVGTLPYMSPEQARGDPVDARTDIFSLGAVLYEAATGQRAFPGTSAAVVIDGVLNRNPPPALGVNANLPGALDGILAKALEKDPDLRYRHVSELRTDLTRLRRDLEIGRTRSDMPSRSARRRFSPAVLAGLIAAVAVAAGLAITYLTWRQPDGPRSMAVLPFVNATADPNLDYLTDGLTVSLINSLADVRELSVKSRASVFRYKGRTDDPLSWGRELRVAALLTGTVTRRGELLHVEAELVDPRTGDQFWGKQFDRRPSELFTLEEEIARSVIDKLAVRPTPDADRRLSRRSTGNIEAYHLYLRGAFHAGTFTRDGLNRAIKYYREALALDPDYARAYAGLAHAYFWFTDWYAPSKEVSPRALDAATRAIQIDESLAEAHGIRGLITMIYVWDWPAAERAFLRALELDAQDARTRAHYAWLLAALKRTDQAIAEARRAQETDPLSGEAVTIAALAMYLARTHDTADAFGRQVVDMYPTFTWAHIVRGRALQAKGLTDAALESLQSANKLEPELSEAVAATANAYAASGQAGRARALLAQLTTLSDKQYVSPIDFATIHAGLGETGPALDWLERGLAHRSYLMPFIDALPFFDLLDAEPRFQALLERLKLPR